jgi:MMPL family protein
VFQWGWGSSLLGVSEKVPVESYVPMMMFAIVFGLSMDYEVFLLSRVREAWLRTGDNHASVALGVFLGAYDGYDNVDSWITNIAGLCAIGVAFCPTKPAVCAAGTQACPASSVTHLSTSQQVAGDFHLFFAAATFIALGLMALRFAKGGKTPPGQSTMGRIRYGLGFGPPIPGDTPPRYPAENVIYRVSGITILSCVLLAALSNLLPASVNAHWPLLFSFEAAAVFAFGVSWFAKGRTIEGMWPGTRKAEPAAKPVAAVR